MPTSTAGNSTDQRGFTLIELAVVVLLIGLFSALVVPRLPWVGEDALKASARRLAGVIKYYYNEAVLKNYTYRLVFNLEEQSFGVVQLEANGTLVPVDGPGRSQSLRGDARFRDVDLIGSGASSQGEVIAEILPNGWIDPTVVHLARPDGEQLTLRVNPLTGTTEVFDGYREFR
jgi:prepilin-type N-terminal cleavage/methylation domain-containing protein